MAIKNNQGDEQIRQRNKDSFHNAALYWNNLANERVFEISKQLLGIALIVLPLTGSIVLADKKISQCNTTLLVVGWFMLFISVISGFINLWIEAKYFVYLSNDSSTREEIWSDTSTLLSKLDEKTVSLGKTKAESSPVPLIVQGVALFIGVFFIMITAYSLLGQDSTNNSVYRKNEKLHNFLYKR